MAAIALLMGLAACNTVKGVGKDVEAAGEGLDQQRRAMRLMRPSNARQFRTVPSHFTAGLSGWLSACRAI